MPTLSRTRWMLGAALVAALCLFATPSSASADWSLCPVDDPAMLGTPPGSYAACVSFKFISPDNRFGKLRLSQSFDYDFGAHGPDAGHLSYLPSTRPGPFPQRTDASFNGLPPLGPALLKACNGLTATPLAALYGGLCYPLAQQLDKQLSAQLEPAGTPSDLSFAALAGTGQVITMPIKIHLNAAGLLGPSCYIGTDTQPITLHLISDAPPTLHTASGDPSTGVASESFHFGGDLHDKSFAVPGATGCGALQPLVNLLLGLPSRSGANSFSSERNGGEAYTTAGGDVLSAYWHQAWGP